MVIMKLNSNRASIPIALIFLKDLPFHIESFFRKNIQAANENIETVTKLEQLCQEINTSALKQEGAVAISLGYIVESIRRIGEYAEDISETVINHLIGEE